MSDDVDPEQEPAANLAIAITRRIKSLPDLMAKLPGGISRNQAAAKPAGPSLVYTIVSSRQGYVTDSSNVLDIRVRLAIFAAESSVAERLRGDVIDAFEDKQTAHARGVSVPWTIFNQAEEQFLKPADLNLTNRFTVDFLVRELQVRS